jgi:hypothetical protein
VLTWLLTRLLTCSQVASAEARLSPHGHQHEHGGHDGNSTHEGLASTISRTVARARGRKQHAHHQQQQPHGSSPDGASRCSVSEAGEDYGSDVGSDVEGDVSSTGASLLGGLSLLNSVFLGGAGGAAVVGGLRHGSQHHCPPQHGPQNGHAPTAGGNRPGMLNGRLSPRAGAKVAPLSAPASPTSTAAAIAAANSGHSSTGGSPRHGSGGGISSVKVFSSAEHSEVVELGSLRGKGTAGTTVHLQDMDSSIREDATTKGNSSSGGKLLVQQLSSAGDTSRQERSFTDSTTDSNSSGGRRLSAAEDEEAGAPLKGRGLVVAFSLHDVTLLLVVLLQSVVIVLLVTVAEVLECLRNAAIALAVPVLSIYVTYLVVSSVKVDQYVCMYC